MYPIFIISFSIHMYLRTAGVCILQVMLSISIAFMLLLVFASHNWTEANLMEMKVYGNENLNLTFKIS